MCKFLPLVIAAALVTGCASISPERTAKMNDRQLCNSYGDARDNAAIRKNLPSLRAEIDRRGLVRAEEWSLIESKEAQLGMSVCALRASWGPAKENALATRYGESIQHVYRLSWCHRCNVKYVYTNNGVVTAIQE
jgi:hypothetical protein